ncbi:hypothetical protein ACTXQV_50190, partial [Klebsiella pneumoniae]
LAVFFVPLFFVLVKRLFTRQRPSQERDKHKTQTKHTLLMPMVLYLTTVQLKSTIHLSKAMVYC